MPDERAMAEAWHKYQLEATPISLTESRTLSEMCFEAGWRAHEAAGRAEAPDADEEALRHEIALAIGAGDPEWTKRLTRAIGALIAYRERRYEAVARLLRESLDWHDRLISDFDIGEARDEQLTQHMDDIRSALRALSERSDG